jgi:glutaredoxin
MYKMYTKDDCPWCIKAKRLLMDCGIQFQELKLGKDYQREYTPEGFRRAAD